MYYLLKGFAIGVLIAAPVGPIGLLCVRRTLTHGRLSGLLSGFGAATADGFYGLVAGLGLTAISGLLLKGQVLLSVVGGLFLCYLGIKTFRAHAVNYAATVRDRGRLQDYFSTLGLTITNPVTILTFLGIFAGLGIKGDDYLGSMMLVLGVFFGSATWWFTLTSLVSLFRHRINPKAMLIIDKASGTLIFVFGLIAMARL